MTTPKCTAKNLALESLLNWHPVIAIAFNLQRYEKLDKSSLTSEEAKLAWNLFENIPKNYPRKYGNISDCVSEFPPLS